MDEETENHPKHLIGIEHTPNGGWIGRTSKFTLMDSAGLEYFCATDPVCRQWNLVDSLCDKRLLPFPELPASDPYNRPGYSTNPDRDASWWTPDEAIKRYGCHLIDDDSD